MNINILVSVEFMTLRNLRWIKEFALGRMHAPLSTLYFCYILRLELFPRISERLFPSAFFTCKVEIQPSRKKLKSVKIHNKKSMYKMKRKSFKERTQEENKEACMFSICVYTCHAINKKKFLCTHDKL